MESLSLRLDLGLSASGLKLLGAAGFFVTHSTYSKSSSRTLRIAEDYEMLFLTCLFYLKILKLRV